MMRILKYLLQPGRTLLAVDEGTRFRSVGWQGDQLVVWAEVPTQAPSIVDALLAAVVTGDPVPPTGEFIGTAQHPTLLDGTPFVAHVYLIR